MGRHKPNHPRRPRPNRSAAMTYADAYRCGHCHSEVSLRAPAPDGIDHIDVAHDAGCPVLNGALPDLPDSLRAAVQAGGTVIIDAQSGVHFTMLPKESVDE
jgi:hypothetical protein